MMTAEEREKHHQENCRRVAIKSDLAYARWQLHAREAEVEFWQKTVDRLEARMKKEEGK